MLFRDNRPGNRLGNRSIHRTAVEVALSGVAVSETIHTGIKDYKLGVVRAQYESVFNKTYESCLIFSENSKPELKYGVAESRIIF